MVKSIASVNIRPVGDRILIQFDEEKEQTRRGIIIPDSAREKPQEAHVIALGTGKREKGGTLIPFEVKVGDRVLVSKYGTMEVTIDEVKYCLAREEDLLGVLA
jgi:chaperonin GroES